MFCFVLVNNKINLICTQLTSRDSCAEVNEVILLENQLCLEARCLPMKMRWINAKNFKEIITSDFFHEINNDVDFIAPLKFHVYVYIE